MEEHYDFGELYVEFIHGNCASKQGELCAHCVQKGWSRPPMNDPIPRPMPNEETLPNYHYKSVLDTPAKAEDGKPRKIDDFQPRANICSQFAEGSNFNYYFFHKIYCRREPCKRLPRTPSEP